jgi:hypothetical protein
MRHPFIICPILFLAAGCSDSSGHDPAVAARPDAQAAERPNQAIPQENARADEPLAPDTPRDDHPIAPDTPRDDHPIPQDLAKVEQRERERLEWFRRTTLGAYERVGKQDPRWDEAVRKTLELAALQSNQRETKSSAEEINAAAKVAIDAGCDDPLLVNIFYRTSIATKDQPIDELIRLRNASIESYATSLYPAFRRASVLQASGSQAIAGQNAGEAARKRAEADFAAVLALLPESVATDEQNQFWEEKWFDIMIELIKGYRKIGEAPQAAYEKVDAELLKHPEIKVLRLQVRGEFWLRFGWEARTTAFAPAVPAGGFETLEKCLGIANEALVEAWKLQPDNARTAASLLDIDKTIGGDRPTMELWFDRAMKADPDKYWACWSKLDWLDPKWHGSPEEMLAFGRQCRNTKNWRAGITLLCADAHWRFACMPGENKNKYLALPEVWADIQSVYDEYLKHHPENHTARSKFALFCYLSAHYREAEVQYMALGNHLTQWSDFPFVPLDELKQIRERNARIVLGKEGRISFPTWHFVRGTLEDGEWFINTPVSAPHQEKPGILGADASHVWNCSADGITYGIRALKLPPSLQNESPERVLDAARSAAAKERGAQPRNLRDTLLAARPAQEYYIDAPGLKPRLLRVKTIVIGTWLYELSVTASKSDVTGGAAREFFDSFAFQPKAK